MAARKSTQVSRRRAVAALGAGVIGSTVAAGAQAPKGPLNTKNCAGHKTTSGFGNANERKQLQLQTCCVYLMDVLQHGHGNAQADPKRLLQPFMNDLADEARRDALMDYCYVQFDLTEEQVKSLYDFSKRFAPAAKK